MTPLRLQIPAAVTALKTLADRTIRLTVDLGRELNPEQSAAVFALLHLEGWMLFQPTPIDENTVDVPDVVPDFKGEKTPAQRLRGTLYRVWETTDRKITFDYGLAVRDDNTGEIIGTFHNYQAWWRVL